METKDFSLWQNRRETEILIKETDQRINLTNKQFYELLRFLGPLVETVFPHPHS
jgi:hypothetical protein